MSLLQKEIQAPSYWNTPPYKEGQRGFLREDLEILRKYLSTTTGAEGLANALGAAGVRRAMEIGVGLEFQGIKMLAALENEQKTPLFGQEDLYAVDPSLLPDDSLKYLERTKGLLDRFSRVPDCVENVAQQVERGELPPFDLVYAKGVASIGNLAGARDIAEWREEGKEIIKAMKDCLSPDNPSAVVMLSTKFNDTLFPYYQQDLDELGLKIVHSEPAEGAIAKRWVKVLQRKDIFPDNPSEPFFRSVICQRK